MRNGKPTNRWVRCLSAAGVAGCAFSVTAAGAFGKDQPAFSPQAVFSDATPQFVNPAEPKLGQPFTISLRTGRDQVRLATLYFGEQPYPMKKTKSDEWFDYYTATVPGQQYPTSYYFQMTTVGGKKFYYSMAGTSSFSPSAADTFTVVPGFQTPSWAMGAVFYQIFPDRFYNGDKSNDVLTNEFMYDGYPSQRVTNWSKYPDGSPYQSGGNRTREFYGGDLQGIIDKLPYLHDLGVQALYLNPVFVAPSNHKYDTQDFDHVDPHLGKIVHDGGKLVNPRLGMSANQTATKYIIRTEDPANLNSSDALLAKLIQKAHAMGIHVVLDGVFEDTGSFNKWFDKAHIYPNTPPNGPGAYESKNSPFHNYYSFNSDSWPNNDSYDSWMGIATLPKLYYENSPTLVKTIYSIAKKWVSPPYNADGWRLDSAANLGYSQNYNLKFWDGFRTAVKSANKNALIIAEWYTDPSLYFDGKGFDSIQNYMAFLTPVSYFLTGLGEHSDQADPKRLNNVNDFLNNMKTTMGVFPYQALYTAMNALDNHDVSRFLTRTNGKVGSEDAGNTPQEANQGTKPNVLEQGVLLDMTWPGDPTIYYGDEAGLTGWTDPDSRRAFPWGHENAALESFYRNIIHVHTDTSCFKTGSLVVFPQSAGHILSYGRFDTRTAAVTVLNVGDKPETVTVPVWELETQSGSRWKVAAQASGSTANAGTGAGDIVQSGKDIQVRVPAHGGVVLTSAKN